MKFAFSRFSTEIKKVMLIRDTLQARFSLIPVPSYNLIERVV